MIIFQLQLGPRYFLLAMPCHGKQPSKPTSTPNQTLPTSHCAKTNKKHILPRNLTWNLKMMVSKRNLLFQGLLFRFHVKFQGGYPPETTSSCQLLEARKRLKEDSCEIAILSWWFNSWPFWDGEKTWTLSRGFSWPPTIGDEKGTAWITCFFFFRRVLRILCFFLLNDQRNTLLFWKIVVK